MVRYGDRFLNDGRGRSFRTAGGFAEARAGCRFRGTRVRLACGAIVRVQHHTAGATKPEQLDNNVRARSSAELDDL
jgi:hypothetical protein